MDNAELLKRLVEEQKRTNLLLAMAERRARQEADAVSQEQKIRAFVAEVKLGRVVWPK